MLIDLIEKSNRGSLCGLREDVASFQVLPELNQIDGSRGYFEQVVSNMQFTALLHISQLAEVKQRSKYEVEEDVLAV